MATLINDRIDVRISREQKELIKYASALRGFKNVSEFIVTFVTNEANKIVSENNNILSTLEDKKIFIEAILNPPMANDKLKNAQLKHSKLIESHEPRIRVIK
jgi:uncharacterized protein (DUF1778 family)